MKDPEKFGLSEAANENLDDMLVATGGSSKKLMALLQFYKEMFDIAKPYTDPKTYQIKAPNNQLPISKLSPEIKQQINAMDSAFIETMSYCGWINVFSEGYQKIKQKLDRLTSDFKEGLK